MLDRLRLLPTVILCASLLLVLKLADLATGGEGSATISAISIAQASAPEEKSDEEAEAHGEAAGHGDTAAGETTAAVPPAPAPAAEPEISKSERTVLQSLASRRKELDTRAGELDTREQLLAAAERRVEERIAELKEIEARINERIGAEDEANEARIAGLVSMYETMKPKDAARIFERLDMGVLLDVVMRMQPRKMAAVLAAMDPVVAQDLTVELATGDRLSGIRAGESADEAEMPAAVLPSGEKAS
jgi:flagellar motility protein MotE (MotC chaperone)